ncbi:hypothetical protein FGADI_184 [Fusarium gaditjirri]|uniref:BZIP domain-containing protein n=1 Tax=Fusarium gaditjirri TaxID=282569 RepID=A0A8H4TPB6_9HYPO|nr:hypothetical protein FGADI_184 [Fusarium gaditjirri]
MPCRSSSPDDIVTQKRMNHRRIPQEQGVSRIPSIMEDAERKKRRKLQNRINQRARRNRMNNDDTTKTRAKQQRPTFGVKLWRVDEFGLEAGADNDECSITKQDSRLFLTTKYRGTLSAADVETYSQQLDMHQRLRALTGGASPLSDHLLYLINYNAFRGLFQNKVILSQVTDHLVLVEGRTEKLDVMVGLKRDAICVETGLVVPPHLRPTALQSARVHATWIDFIPFPKMRDNLITHHEHFNHRLLVTDIMGDLLDDIMFNKYGEGTGPRGRRLVSRGKPGDYASDRRGMIIWGEPHRMESWEVTPRFLERWGWAVEGCPELMRATNHWRALRGNGVRVGNLWNLEVESIEVSMTSTIAMIDDRSSAKYIVYSSRLFTIMIIARQLLSSFGRLSIVTSTLRPQPVRSPYTSIRMNSGKVKTPVSSDPNHDKNNPPVADHSDGAMASLKGAPGKRDASSFEDKNMTEKEKNTNSQNAQEQDRREGSTGEAGHFEKSGRKPKM